VRREATGPAAPGWEVDCGGAPCAAGEGVVGRSDVTARAKREARWRERAGVPSPRAGVLGVRRRPSSRGGGGAMGAGPPAQTGGRPGPCLGAPASCRVLVVAGRGGCGAWHPNPSRPREVPAGLTSRREALGQGTGSRNRRVRARGWVLGGAWRTVFDIGKFFDIPKSDQLAVGPSSVDPPPGPGLAREGQTGGLAALEVER
jgi:hypothetical protein